jgi:hypothetical protein
MGTEVPARIAVPVQPPDRSVGQHVGTCSPGSAMPHRIPKLSIYETGSSYPDSASRLDLLKCQSVLPVVRHVQPAVRPKCSLRQRQGRYTRLQLN